MSIRSYSWALKLPVKPAAKKSVLLVLADYASDRGKSYPELKTFKRDSGLGAEAVETQLAALCAEGLITDTGIRVGDLKDVRVFQLNPVKELELKPAEPKPRKKLKNEALEEAAKIYEVYPRKVGRPKALLAIARCIKTYGFEVVMNGTKIFADAWKESGRTDLAFCAHPSTWFNRESFNDDPASWGFTKTPTAISGIPKYSEMMAFVKEKESDAIFCAKVVTGFQAHWTKQQWKKNGLPIEWKIELSNFIGRARAQNQKNQSVGIPTH